MEIVHNSNSAFVFKLDPQVDEQPRAQEEQSQREFWGDRTKDDVTEGS